MFRDYLNNLQVLSSHTLTAHLTTHAQTLEHLCRVRASTNRTWLTEAVILTVSRLTYTTESVTFHNTLEAFTFGSSDNVNKVIFTKEFYSHSFTEIELLFVNKLSQVTLGSNTSLLEVTEERSRNILFLYILKANLHSRITVFFNSLNLSYYARTAFNYSARHIFAVGTENGSHSDFLT